MRRHQNASCVISPQKVIHTAKICLKLWFIEAVLKPQIFKLRENRMREIQEVPVLYGI